MNKFEKYEYIRSISEEDFNTLKEMWNAGKGSFFEKASKVAKWGLAAWLAYLAYDAFGYGDTVVCIINTILAVGTAFKNKIFTFAKSSLASYNLLKGKDIAQCNDIYENYLRITRELQDYVHELKKRKYEQYEEENK